ncbi:ankyrin repeat protein [Acanthamoeba polyphaga mimivirus]|uniref:Ankyrin repeat protein n=1 Tax=Acanthamoeba polyphaga mimivirus TaxID=212035 RepID=A0A2L2DKT1_MIMIV|nr:ankyrin repeat protein [Acanthamoeba polyphaga mimivirus]
MDSSMIDSKFYKFIDENWIQRGFLYKEGLNVLDKPFEKHGSCVPGGLYFTDIANIHNYLSYGTRLVEVTIPIDAQVVADDYDSHKWRADKIIIKNIGIITDVHTIQYLIDKGANFSRGSFYRFLMENNHLLLKCLSKDLLKNSHKIQKKIKNTKVSHGYYEDNISYLLIKYGAEIDDYFINDIIEGECLNLAKAILKYKTSLTNNLYVLAGKYNKLGIIELVYKYFPKIKSCYHLNNEIIRYAVINNNPNIVKYMINNGFYFSADISTFISNEKINNTILYLNTYCDIITKNNELPTSDSSEINSRDSSIRNNIIDYREYLEYQ